MTRTQTSHDSFGSDDEVKFDSSGGSDAWPRDEYLNIWVCQLSGGLLGYAQFPGGPAETDGVVITHTGFGTTGTAAAPFDQGRTATHEIGHWLNLRHIWGDDGTGCSGSDFVDDTPNQGGGNTGKPTFPTISCNNGPNGDMFMNYMDYVDDDAMVMFTEGQITRMHACLDGPRSAIGTSISCSGGVAKPPFKEPPKERSRSSPRTRSRSAEGPDQGLQGAAEGLQGSRQGLPKDRGLKEPPKDFKEPPKDFPRTPPKDFKEPPKDFKEPPKDFKERPKDFIKDPITDPGPKTIFEPPTPKSATEPPFEPPGGPLTPVQPLQPIQPVTPFVLATGRPPEAPAQTAGAQLLGHYAQILQHYAGLHRRGLLDAQGMAAWQQVHAAYRQVGGQ